MQTREQGVDQDSDEGRGRDEIEGRGVRNLEREVMTWLDFEGCDRERGKDSKGKS